MANIVKYFKSFNLYTSYVKQRRELLKWYDQIHMIPNGITLGEHTLYHNTILDLDMLYGDNKEYAIDLIIRLISVASNYPFTLVNIGKYYVLFPISQVGKCAIKLFVAHYLFKVVTNDTESIIEFCNNVNSRRINFIPKFEEDSKLVRIKTDFKYGELMRKIKSKELKKLIRANKLFHINYIKSIALYINCNVNDTQLVNMLNDDVNIEIAKVKYLPLAVKKYKIKKEINEIH